MKTALGSRSKRGIGDKKVGSILDESEINLNERRSNARMDSLSELERITSGAKATNGVLDESDESRSSCATPTANKKKRASGIKKMVKKFF